MSKNSFSGSTSFLVIISILVIFSGCIGNQSHSTPTPTPTTTPTITAPTPVVTSTPTFQVKGQVLKEYSLVNPITTSVTDEYYVNVTVTNTGTAPIVLNKIEHIFIGGYYNDSIAGSTYSKDEKGWKLMPGESLNFDFSTMGRGKKLEAASREYGVNYVVFYILFFNGDQPVGGKGYLTYLPFLEKLSYRHDNPYSGVTLNFVRVAE